MAAKASPKTARVALTGVNRDHFNTLRVPPGTLVLITDLPTYELEPIEDKSARIDSFTLEATDGSYKRTVIVKDDHASFDNWVDLVFEDLPTRRHFTLKATLHGEDEVVIFENVAYAELAKQTDALRQQEREPSEFGEF
jgi:hypothetical protein